VRQKGFAPILIILIALIAVAGAYYLGTKKGNLSPALTPLPTIATNTPSQVSPATNPTTEPAVNWESYQAPKTEFSKAFTLYYPPTWKLEVGPPIKLSKGSVSFEFRQGAGSVGACLFNDDKDNQNAPMFATVFPSFYREIKKSEQRVWRLATEENPQSWDDTFILCEKLAGESFYSQYTNIGYVPFRVSQSDIISLNEIVAILTKIKITE
jgi:hypothetical protein